MGYNTTVVVLNDALEFIEQDLEFSVRLVKAIREMSEGPDPDKGPIDVQAVIDKYSSFKFGNAATVIETHHADEHVLVRDGGNTGEVVNGATKLAKYVAFATDNNKHLSDTIIIEGEDATQVLAIAEQEGRIPKGAAIVVLGVADKIESYEDLPAAAPIYLKPLNDCGDLMVWIDFVGAVASGSFIDDDGYGRFATVDKYDPKVPVLPSDLASPAEGGVRETQVLPG